ncbi:MAG TPA: hypothetical protein VNS19_14725 [Acidimicrobiales bacterium]|nr:hypothetical protein [Acidimicrobiales bacterium]
MDERHHYEVALTATEVLVLAELDGRYLSTEVAGGMLGRVVGVYAMGGDAHVSAVALDLG